MSENNKQQNKVNYRRLYERHHGPIPKDEHGRTFDIHHIDGNHYNNDITNLRAVSIQEHYNIHYSQGDWAACHRILARMGTDPAKVAELGRLASVKRVENGTHNFLGGKIQSESNKRRIAEGNHPFLDGDRSRQNNLKRMAEGRHHFVGETNPVYKQLAEGKHPWVGGEVQSRNSKRRVEEGTHHFVGGAIHRKRVQDGTHPFLGGEVQRKYAAERIAAGTHQNFRPLECPHCGKQGKGSIMLRWHFDNCKLRN